MTDPFAQARVHFDVFRMDDRPYELSNDVDALLSAGIRILAPDERITLPAELYVCGADFPVPADAAIRHRLESAVQWRSVVAEAGFPKSDPCMDYLAGAIYSACDIAGDDGLVVDRTSGIIVSAAKLRDLDENTEVRDTVVIAKQAGGGAITLTTHGLVKYGQREIVAEIASDVEDALCGYLYNNVFPNIVRGHTVFPGETLQNMNPPFRLAFIPEETRLRMVDAPDEPRSDLQLLAEAIRRTVGRS
ncbi:MAG: hypothetical protein JST00_10925 [Deltaproteobacteria bacterium]|nr:hypothetical protein [Deltaproteobacteria bacterium]